MMFLLGHPSSPPFRIPTPPAISISIPTPKPITTLSVDSTSYCQGGTMADGEQTYIGAAAGNLWRFGTRIKILSGRLAGTIVTISDRIGWGSQLDIFNPSCAWAIQYGRERIEVQIVRA